MPEVAILVQLREVHVHIIVRLVDLMVIGPSVTNRPGLIGSLIGCERSPSQWPSPSAGSWGFLGGKRPPLTSGLWAGYRWTTGPTKSTRMKSHGAALWSLWKQRNA